MTARTPGNTAKALNISVAVGGTLTVDEVEHLLRDAAHRIGLVQTHVTTLSKKKYPGNRHWHYKQTTLQPGCLDVTYWPSGQSLWITVRNREPEWVHSAGPVMASKIRAHLEAAPTTRT